ncbi:MAG: glycine cleavage system aminomethyltransferase GcvT [Ignavibacteria bacterium]
MAKRTPLYEAHVAAGAKIVDFAGWDMPINYGSQIEEHHKVRSDSGMFDVSHMRAVDVTGKDAQAFLRRLVANDVAKLAIPGKALYSCMLKDDGGVIDDLIVYFFTPERYRVVVNAGTADKDLAWMKQQAGQFSDVTVADRPEFAMIAVQGPNARERFWTAFPAGRARTVLLQPFQAVEWDGWLVARTGYTGEDGFEITLPAAQAMAVWDKLKEAGVPPIGLGARDTLRLEAGMNLYGQDMDEGQNPLESGLTWTVDLKDPNRDFIGRKALAALKPTRQFVGLVLLDRGVLRSHQKIFTPLGEGETTSGSFSPTTNKSIALGRVPVGVNIGDIVEVEIRDKRLQAKVVKPTFARNGKSMI